MGLEIQTNGGQKLFKLGLFECAVGFCPEVFHLYCSKKSGVEEESSKKK